MTEEARSAPVLVTGATGYLGSHLVSRLVERGFRVRCLAHDQARLADLDFLAATAQEVITLALDQESAAIDRAFDSAGSLVHLIGSIAPKKGESFESLHRDLTARIADLCNRFGLSKIVLVTACGTRKDSPSQYHTSKWAAEEALRESGIPHAILRPSLIVGKQVGSRDSKLVKRLLEAIREKPFVPLVEGGVNRIQPIFIGDVVDAIAAALEEPSKETTLEIGGPETLTMRELVERLASIDGKEARIVNLPRQAGHFLAGVLEMIQEVPILSQDQVVLSLSDNICQTNGLEELIGRPATGLDEALATYANSSALPELTGGGPR